MSKNLFKSTSMVSLMTFISRLLGFARDIVWAHTFGAAAGFDAFIVAFKIPNFMRRLFAEGAFSQAFVPVLSEYQQTQSASKTQEFINRIAGALGASLLLVVLVGEVLTPLIVMLFAPGFLDEPLRFGMASDMLRITFPYVLLISLTAFSGAVLNCFHQFTVPAFTPVLLNIALIVATVWLAPYLHLPVTALAWGVLIGGVFQLCFQLPFLLKYGVFPKPRFVWRDPGVRKVLKLMLPALFGVSVAQLSLLIDTLFASFLPAGSISWLYYSERLTFFPLGVFGVALATVVLPHLSRQHAAQSKESFSKALDWALRSLLVLAVPAAIGLFMLAGPLLSTLFQNGHFTGHDVIMAQLSLMAYATGLLGFMGVKVLASAFYAKQNIRTPVRIAVIAVAVNLGLNLALIIPLKHAGLALATALASLVNAGLLLRGLVKRDIIQFARGWQRYLIQLLFANATMATTLWLLTPAIGQWITWSWQSRALQLSIILLAAVGSYTMALWISGIRLTDFLAKNIGSQSWN